ncbi:unnamed protein product [Peniophora sp. CBMAI 1063]|nr:unnamed protein product [Peniophora sp. CBMAI 1063]
MVSASLLVLSLGALSAFAAPSKRQSADNGSCRALQTTCAGSVKSDLSDAWNIKACVFGATCFGGQHPVDGFLAAVYADRGLSGTAPQSVNLPRVTTSLFNSISTDGKTVSQQNFIDGYYSSLDATGGPYPTSAQYVIDLFGNLQDWTAFCNAAIPFQNFADYFQYSSSVSSSNCGVATAGILSPVTSEASAVFTSVLASTFTSRASSAVTSQVSSVSASVPSSAVTSRASQVSSAVTSALPASAVTSRASSAVATAPSVETTAA